MDIWRSTIHRIVSKGIERHEIRSDVDSEAFATVFIATLEGALMLSKLYQDTVHMHRAIDHLTHYVQLDLQTPNSV
jgi:TetR/AcrR family transcriptional regulator, transcriptional repressor for nem operon